MRRWGPLVRRLDRRFCSQSPQTTGKGVAKVEGEVAQHAESEVTQRAKNEVGPAEQQRQPFRGGQSIEALLVEKRRREFLELYPDAPIDRYLPPSDPYALLIEKEKLTVSESRWQNFFVALPWLVFLSMVATPFLILKYHLDKWDGRGSREEANTEAEKVVLRKKRICHGLERFTFNEMPDVIEGREVALVVLYHPSTFRSMLVLPFLHDLGVALRDSAVKIRVVALDLSSVPENDAPFRKAYPAVTAPHLQAIVPTNGDADIIDAHSVTLSAQKMLSFVAPYVELPEELIASARAIDDRMQVATEDLVASAFLEEPPAVRGGLDQLSSEIRKSSEGLQVAMQLFVPKTRSL